MSQLKASLAVIEKWRRKSSELSTHRKDALFTAATRGFEAMAAVVDKESDNEHIHQVLARLNFERTLSLQYEKLKDDPTRDIMHGFLESLHLVFSEWAEGRNQVKETGEMLTQIDEAMVTTSSIPIVPRDGEIEGDQAILDDNQIPDWNFGVEEEKKFNIKDEVMDDGLNAELNDPEYATDYPFNDQLSLIGNDQTGTNIPPSDFMNNETPFTEELYVGDPNLDQESPMDDISVRMEDMEDIVQTEDSSEKAEVGKGRRPSRRVSKTVTYTDSVHDSDGEFELTTKKPRSDSAVKKENKRRSIEKQSESVNKEPKVAKRSDTEMECPECEYRTNSVIAWVLHLRNIHSTTPFLAGLALRCECGHECHSQSHSYSCNIANFTVIRKTDGPIRRIEDKKTTPQCILCEKFPKTTYGYIHHLQDHHNTNLRANGIYLMCACGLKFTEKRSHPNQSKCDGRDFALHKLDEE